MCTDAQQRQVAHPRQCMSAARQEATARQPSHTLRCSSGCEYSGHTECMVYSASIGMSGHFKECSPHQGARQGHIRRHDVGACCGQRSRRRAVGAAYQRTHGRATAQQLLGYEAAQVARGSGHQYGSRVRGGGHACGRWRGGGCFKWRCTAGGERGKLRDGLMRLPDTLQLPRAALSGLEGLRERGGVGSFGTRSARGADVFDGCSNLCAARFCALMTEPCTSHATARPPRSRLAGAGAEAAGTPPCSFGCHHPVCDFPLTSVYPAMLAQAPSWCSSEQCASERRARWALQVGGTACL